VPILRQSLNRTLEWLLLEGSRELYSMQREYRAVMRVSEIQMWQIESLTYQAMHLMKDSDIGDERREIWMVNKSSSDYPTISNFPTSCSLTLVVPGAREFHATSDSGVGRCVKVSLRFHSVSTVPGGTSQSQ
jgi:hypothetical protein